MTDSNRCWHLLRDGRTVLSAPDLNALRRLVFESPIPSVGPQEACDDAFAGALNRPDTHRLTTVSRGLDTLLTELILRDGRYGHTTVLDATLLDAHLPVERRHRWPAPDPGP
jgi:hypothetical protein